jgi:hypothetical protein
MGREIQLRACCGKLRWALIEAIDPLPAGTHIRALRWGNGLIPIDIDVGSGGTADVVDTVLDEAERWLGGSPSCYTGRGALVIG